MPGPSSDGRRPAASHGGSPRPGPAAKDAPTTISPEPTIAIHHGGAPVSGRNPPRRRPAVAVAVTRVERCRGPRRAAPGGAGATTSAGSRCPMRLRRPPSRRCDASHHPARGRRTADGGCRPGWTAVQAPPAPCASTLTSPVSMSWVVAVSRMSIDNRPCSEVRLRTKNDDVRVSPGTHRTAASRAARPGPSTTSSRPG